MQQGRRNITACKWNTATSMGCARNESCYLSADCRLSILQRHEPTNSNYFNILPNEVDYAIRSQNTTSYVIYPTINTNYLFYLLAAKVMTSQNYTCHLGLLPAVNLSVYSGSVLTQWTTTSLLGGANVTLISPAVGALSIYNTTNSSVYFRAEANNISVDNCTLYFNNTANYTDTGNLSQDITFDNTTSLVWGVRCAYCNSYWWNWNANRSLLVWIEQASISQQKAAYFIKTEPSLRPERIIVAIAGFILSVASGLALASHHKNRKNEDVEDYEPGN
jgi:hypothetical protein